MAHRDEPVALKAFDDAFSDTDLDAVCAGLGVSSLLICGARFDRRVGATFNGVTARGLVAVLVADAHSTVSRSVPTGPSSPPLLVPAEHIVAWQNFQAAHARPGPNATDAFTTSEVLAYLAHRRSRPRDHRGSRSRLSDQDSPSPVASSGPGH